MTSPQVCNINIQEGYDVTAGMSHNHLTSGGYNPNTDMHRQHYSGCVTVTVCFFTSWQWPCIIYLIGIFTVTVWFITTHKRSLRRLCFHRCLSVHRERVSAPLHAGIPPGIRGRPPGTRGRHPGTRRRPPPWQTPSPRAVHARRYGQQAFFTHPTGMHTTFYRNLYRVCPRGLPHFLNWILKTQLSWNGHRAGESWLHLQVKSHISRIWNEGSVQWVCNDIGVDFYYFVPETYVNVR